MSLDLRGGGEYYSKFLTLLLLDHASQKAIQDLTSLNIFNILSQSRITTFSKIDSRSSMENIIFLLISNLAMVLE